MVGKLSKEIFRAFLGFLNKENLMEKLFGYFIETQFLGRFTCRYKNVVRFYPSKRKENTHLCASSREHRFYKQKEKTSYRLLIYKNVFTFHLLKTKYYDIFMHVNPACIISWSSSNSLQLKILEILNVMQNFFIGTEFFLNKKF